MGKFILLHTPKIDFWGYRVISLDDSDEKIIEAVQFLLDSAYSHNIYQHQGDTTKLDHIDIYFYFIQQAYTLECIVHKRWHNLVETDFDVFHDISNSIKADIIFSTQYKIITIAEIRDIIPQNDET
ncbi:hypothetical protein ABCW44_07100 [Mannheimia haemolytica]|uniref:hypothetical protein n=1 Tax=Mannheimia haemolytica TaxID=75985 RepID=UPI0028C63F68|nr:hypothetical protein [Mannheimia haemolytica]HDZ6814034.1 hypothetical protein [Mannheimia haemolytica]